MNDSKLVIIEFFFNEMFKWKTEITFIVPLEKSNEEQPKFKDSVIPYFILLFLLFSGGKNGNIGHKWDK